MKSNVSVWSWPYATRYYLTHPWKWFNHLFRNIKDAYRRAVYGWTYVDVWDMDNWIMNVFPPMLRHMADKGCAYPGRDRFDTPEKWHKWLHAMADLLESGLEDKQNECNEYYKEYMEHLFDEPLNSNENVIGRLVEMDRDYYERAEEIGADAARNIKIAFQELSKEFFNLWD